MPSGGKKKRAADTIKKNLLEVLRRFPDGPPPLDPAKDMKVETPELATVANVQKLNARLAANAFNGLPDDEKQQRYERYLHWVHISERNASLKRR